MKPLLGAALCFVFIGTATAGAASLRDRLRFADAASDACVASCASQADSCKRVCPLNSARPDSKCRVEASAQFPSARSGATL